MVHKDLRDALAEAFENAYKDSLYYNEPCPWIISYGRGYGWFLLITADMTRWARA